MNDEAITNISVSRPGRTVMCTLTLVDNINSLLFDLGGFSLYAANTCVWRLAFDYNVKILA